MNFSQMLIKFETFCNIQAQLKKERRLGKTEFIASISTVTIVIIAAEQSQDLCLAKLWFSSKYADSLESIFTLILGLTCSPPTPEGNIWLQLHFERHRDTDDPLYNVKAQGIKRKGPRVLL